MIQLDDHIFQVGWKIIDSKGPILSSSKIGPDFWSAGGLLPAEPVGLAMCFAKKNEGKGVLILYLFKWYWYVDIILCIYLYVYIYTYL